MLCLKIKKKVNVTRALIAEGVMVWNETKAILRAQAMLSHMNYFNYTPRANTAGWNINNLRYADDTTLMAEMEEKLKSLLMKVKEKSEKADLKLNTHKTKTMATGPITSWHINEETMETVKEFYFLGLQNHCR